MLFRKLFWLYESRFHLNIHIYLFFCFGLEGENVIQKISLVNQFSKTVLYPFSFIKFIFLYRLCYGLECDMHAVQFEAHPHIVQLDEQRRRVRREDHRGVGQEDKGHSESS